MHQECDPDFVLCQAFIDIARLDWVLISLRQGLFAHR